MKIILTLCLIMFVCCYRTARGETTNLNLNEIPGTITITENTDKLILKRGSIQYIFTKVKSLNKEKYYITYKNDLNSWTSNGNGPYPQEAYSAALYAVASKDIEEDNKNGTIKFSESNRLQTSILPGNPDVRSVSSDIVENCYITVSGIQFLEEEEVINGQVVSFTGANIPPKETIWYVNQLTVLEKYPEKPPISYFGTTPANLVEVIKLKEPSVPQAVKNPSELKISKHGKVLTVVKGGNKADFDIGAPLSELYRSAGGIFLAGEKDSEMYIANVWGIPASEMPRDLGSDKEDLNKVQMLYLVTSEPEIINKIKDIKDTGVWFGGIKITGNFITPRKGSRIAFKETISNGEWTINNIPWHYIYVTGVENVFKEEEHNAEENENIVYKKYDKNMPKGTKQPIAPPYDNSFKDSVTGMEFVFVQGGVYTMGLSAKFLEKFNSYYQNKSTSSVEIENRFSDDKSNNDYFMKVKIKVPDFYISKYETTQSQWVKIMKTNPSRNQNMDCPVEMVSWYDVQKFIKKMNELTGRKYCLPTEYEWEYAAGSGGKDENWSGTSDDNSLAEYAWFLDNSGFKTHPVGEKKPNGLTVCDMTGNVAEYCSNIKSYSGTPEDVLAKLSNSDMARIMIKYCVEHFGDIVISYLNPSYNPKSGKPDYTYLGRPNFVIRGGSFNSSKNASLIGLRKYSYYGNGADSDVGFRVILPMSREFVEYDK